MTDGHSRRPVPSSTADLWRMVRAAGVVLSHPAYAVLALSMALLGLTLFVVSLNRTVVALALTGTLPTGVRLAVLVRLYPFVGTAFGSVDGGLVGLVAVLFGVDVAMLTYTLRGRADSSGIGENVTAAAVATLLAAAATVAAALLGVLVSVLGVAGAGPVLPMAGFEFVLIATVAVLLSVHWLSDRITTTDTGRVSSGRPDR